MATTGLPAPPGAETVWGWVAEERVALAARLEALDAQDWDRPSLCVGWRVRDVLGHLVWLAEAGGAAPWLDLLRQLRPPPAAFVRIGRREGAHDPAVLLDRLRAAAGGRFVAPTQGPLVALGDVLVHGSDALRPAGASVRPADDRAGLVADRYRRIGPVFGARRTGRIRFVAEDAGWAVGPEQGPEARGPGEAVLLALAGRSEGRAELTGPGAAHLRA